MSKRKCSRIILIVLLVLSSQIGCQSAYDSRLLLEQNSQIIHYKARYTSISDSGSSEYLKTLISRLSQQSSLNTRVKLSIIYSPEAIALSSQSGEILLSTAVVNSLTSESQFAFIVAHELAHIELGHIINAVDLASAYSQSQSLELEADRHAMQVILALGFDPKQALLALAGVYRLRGIDVSVHSHPAFSKRAFELQKQMLQSEITHYSSNTSEREFNRFKQGLRNR